MEKSGVNTGHEFGSHNTGKGSNIVNVVYAFIVLFRLNEARKLFLYSALKNGIYSPSKRLGGNSIG